MLKFYFFCLYFISTSGSIGFIMRLLPFKHYFIKHSSCFIQHLFETRQQFIKSLFHLVRVGKVELYNAENFVGFDIFDHVFVQIDYMI